MYRQIENKLFINVFIHSKFLTPDGNKKVLWAGLPLPYLEKFPGLTCQFLAVVNSIGGGAVKSIIRYGSRNRPRHWHLLPVTW